MKIGFHETMLNICLKENVKPETATNVRIHEWQRTTV